MNPMRVAYVATVAMVAGSGCAQLFGLDETSSAGAGATIDLRRVSIGASVVTGPLDLGANRPAFLVPDATDPSGLRAVVAVQLAPGQWSAAVAGEPSVIYTAPDLKVPFQHELELASRSTRADFLAFEHPSPQPAPASNVMVDVTLPSPFAAGQALQIAAIGAWTDHVLAGAELPAPGATAIATTIPYASFTAMTNSPPARISAQDVVVVLRYTGNSLTDAFAAPAFDQTTGSDLVTGTMTAVVANTPFDATVDPTTVATRFAAVQPKLTGLSLVWSVAASPGYTVGAPNGVELAAGAIATTDKTFSASYGNPFAALDWQPMLSYATFEARTYTLGGATMTLSASLTQTVDPAPGLALALPVGLPTTISIAQIPLTTDGVTVTLDPVQPAAIDLAIDNPANTVYSVTLDEIVVVGSQVTRTPVVTVLGAIPHLALPPHVLQPGHTYTLSAACLAGGYPNAAAGDLRTFALPSSIGRADSGVFTVAAL